MVWIGEAPANKVPIPARGALISRDRELDLLWRRFEHGGGVTLVAGEPGIGKSRLLFELASAAEAAGAAVLKGSATEATGLPPFLPFLEALGDFCKQLDTRSLVEFAGDTPAVLATLLPEIARRVDVDAGAGDLPVNQARFRLFEAVTGFLHAVALTRPALLILDDLQWADPATLDLLLHLARRSFGTRLSIAGAFRKGEIELNPALRRALPELNRLRVLEVIDAGRFDEAATAALARSWLGGAVAPDGVRELFRQSEGNPFFAEELLRAWTGAGIFIRDGGSWVLTKRPATTASITDAIRQRFTGVPEQLRELLRTAAVIGRTFDVDLLAGTTGHDAEAVEEMLTPALTLGLLALFGDRDYHFSHDKIRECLYAEVTPTRRRRLHGFIGRAIEQRDERDSAALAALAFHFGNSGDRAKGSAYALQAMHAAAETFALESAIGHGSIALSLQAEADPGHGDLRLHLAHLHMLASNYRDAHVQFDLSSAWFLAKGETSRAVAALHGKGNALWRMESIPQAHEALGSALGLLGSDDSAERASVLVDLSSLVATSELNISAGLELAEEAVRTAVAAGDRGIEASATRTLGNLYVRMNKIEVGIAELERALAIATEEDDPVEASECCACLLIAHYWRGQIDRIDEYARKQIAFAGRTHDLFQLRHVYCWLAGMWCMRGDVEEMEQALSIQEEIVERLGAPDPRAYFDSVHGMVLVWRGEYLQAEPILRRAFDLYRVTNPSALPWNLGLHALALFALGREEEALAVRDELEQLIAGNPPESLVIPEAVNTLAPIAIAHHDGERMARYRDQLRPFGGRLANNLVDRMLGMLAAAERDWDAANEHFRRAEHQARQGGLTLELALTLEQRARLAGERAKKSSFGDARACAEEAGAIFDEMGLHAFAARVRAVAAPRGRPGNALPAGLSEREAEVLRLLASGASNREIAEALFISDKTVANHVTSIFTKTGTGNRVAAAAFAIRNGLESR